jgi:trypsin
MRCFASFRSAIVFLAALILKILSSSHVAEAAGETRIIGGSLTEDGEYPYFVNLGDCGGSLIAPSVVLTVAHCALDFVDKYVLIGANKREKLTGNTQKAKVIDEIPHPKYDDDSLENDIMLLRLEREVDMESPSADYRFSWNENGNLPSDGQDLTVIGMGVISDGGNDPSDYLLDVNVQAIPYSECNRNYDSNGQVNDAIMFCAGDVERGGRDACQGDSGGPIVIRNGDRHVQVGMVSWGEGCGSKGKPGVYTRLSGFTDWVKNIICDCWSMRDVPFCDNYISMSSDPCPVPSPIVYIDPDCEDYPDYVDRFEDPCLWYELNDKAFCPNYGEVGGGDEFKDITPGDACCHCGGGDSETINPTLLPTRLPTSKPTGKPSQSPTPRPSPITTSEATVRPTLVPTSGPTLNPTDKPSPRPTPKPIPIPTSEPTVRPTLAPTPGPTSNPTDKPSPSPTPKPSPLSSLVPSSQPSNFDNSVVAPPSIETPLKQPPSASTIAPTKAPVDSNISGMVLSSSNRASACLLYVLLLDLVALTILLR